MGSARLEQLVNELVRLNRVQVQPVARRLLEESLFSDGEPEMDRIQVYAALDGTPQREIAGDIGVSQTSVSRWAREWKRQGLVDAEGRAVFDPYDFFPDLEG